MMMIYHSFGVPTHRGGDGDGDDDEDDDGDDYDGGGGGGAGAGSSHIRCSVLCTEPQQQRTYLVASYTK